MNTWFTGQQASKKGLILRDEMITLKNCDATTAQNLYGRPFNPLSITIMCPTELMTIIGQKPMINGGYKNIIRLQHPNRTINFK